MAELTDNLKQHLAELVAQQRTGRYEERMGYKPSRGLHVFLQPKEGGKDEAEATVCEGITRAQLRKLKAAGALSITAPRAAWSLKLRPAAYDLVG